MTSLRDRAADDRGAVLVEFAIVLPILSMFLFGVVSAGIAWNNNLALAHAARVGGRYAATLPTRNYASMDAYLDAVATRVVAGAEGGLDTTVAGRVMCIAYVSGGSTTLDKTRRRNESGTTVTRADTSCFTDNQASTEKRVQIMVERSVRFEAGVWSTTATIHQQLVFHYEIVDGL